MNIPSKIVSEAVEQFSNLPGIGKRTALRFVLHLLKSEKAELEDLSTAVLKLKNNIVYCKKCFDISDYELCEICSNPARDETTICVVEDIRDVMAIESTSQFKGLYHVLGGIISPMDGIGPNDLKIEQLVERVKNENIKEIIFALSTTMEGDTTNFYIYKRLKDQNVKNNYSFQRVAVGDELAYADEVTLGNSIKNRTIFEV